MKFGPFAKSNNIKSNKEEKTKSLEKDDEKISKVKSPSLYNETISSSFEQEKSPSLRFIPGRKKKISMVILSYFFLMNLKRL